MEQKELPPAKVKYDPVARRQESGNLPAPTIKERPRLLCAQCEEHIPFTEFGAGTDPLCEKCRENEPKRKESEISAERFQQLSKQLTKAAGQSKELPRLENMLSEFMVNAGGMRNFCKQWWDQFELAMTNRPGSHGVLQMFQSLAKLVMDVNKLQHQEEILDLNEEQLRQQKELAMINILTQAASDPGSQQMLIAALRSTGSNLTDEIAVEPEPEEVGYGAD